MTAEPSKSQTEDNWEELYRLGLGAPRYPNSYAVRWLFGNFSRAQAADIKLLDMGCGMGRHAIMMAQEGFSVTATDYAESAIAQAKIWAKAEELDIDFSQSSATDQPFPDQSFDGILCYGVLYYLSLAKFTAAVSEIHRLLKDGGSTFVMVKNDRDIRKMKATETTPHHYKITAPDEGLPWHNEQGMTLTLLPKAEIIKCFRDFSKLKIEEITSTLEDGRYLEAAWLIYAQK